MCVQIYLLMLPGKLLKLVREKFSGVFPEMEIKDGHCLTYLEIINNPASYRYDKMKIGNVCDEHYYWFSCNRDRERHFTLCHDGKPTSSYLKDSFTCNYLIND